ncbi:MAG: DUF1028 domain-containing protein [Calditrichaceae bacterium]|nr:DUF1028 domain-containing protein [Calditrichaceae bacterium]
MRIVFISLLALISISFSQTINNEPLTHTFSIIAIDKEAGEIGVAVQSHWFSVGSIVAWAEPGIGAIATQSLVNVSFGPRGLELLKSGIAPQNALQELLSTDEGKAFRQVSIINTAGEVAAYTGEKCIADASHITGEGYSVQANMMLNDHVVPAMSEAFENSSGALAERMIGSLKAAQAAGGDIRGQQSACLLIVKSQSSGKIWEDRLIDLRVEDHPEAVDEIARLLKVFRAYEHMNNGDLAIEKNDEELALKEYHAAEEMFPGNLEMQFWTAVSLANIGKMDEALALFKKIFSADRNWHTLTNRIVKNGLLNISKENLEKILTL